MPEVRKQACALGNAVRKVRAVNRPEPSHFREGAASPLCADAVRSGIVDEIILAGLADRQNLQTEQAAPAHQADQEAGLVARSEEHTSELQSRENLVCRLLLEKKKK